MNYKLVHRKKIFPSGEIDERDTWLQLLMSEYMNREVEDKPCFIYHFPASQAALPCIEQGVASRFEIYYRGIELANGFHELQDASEQRKRFEKI